MLKVILLVLILCWLAMEPSLSAEPQTDHNRHNECVNSRQETDLRGATDNCFEDFDAYMKGMEDSTVLVLFLQLKQKMVKLLDDVQEFGTLKKGDPAETLVPLLLMIDTTIILFTFVIVIFFICFAYFVLIYLVTFY